MDNYYQELICLRRKLHSIAEIGWLEIETTIFLLEYLEKLGFNIQYGREIHSERIELPNKKMYKQAYESNKNLYNEKYKDIFDGYTGLIASFNTNTPGKTTAFRFDIDALEITESQDSEHFPYKEGFASKNTKFMHACGHDGHMAIGLTLAHWIANNSNDLSGNFIFIFQPAEEGVRGAKSILNKGVLPKIDYLFGMHIGLGMKENYVGVGTIDFLGNENMQIKFSGKYSHAGNKPEDGCNSLLAAASASLMMHSITQYSSGIARVNVGTFTAGRQRNSVPGEAVLGVEIRANKKEILDDLIIKTENIVKGAAISFQNDYNISYLGHSDCYNHVNKDLACFIENILLKKNINVQKYPSFNASEDITSIMNFVENNGGKSIHMLFGAKLSASHHNKKFDFDENVLKLAFDSFTEIVNNFSLKQK
ncbi:amidohydrolase [Sedimentibacter sp. zth1]|uniref:amidohydrolase n=1 Tax=Sedimentibacter sp. zth1 TaxID=2816908 RepID=UPI001A932C3D|nr:amidohydrolase [Sedimentibacter sp. zth1]QSX04777.1 amidohydrolase [Sedimentibacter sp. zth1]